MGIKWEGPLEERRKELKHGITKLSAEKIAKILSKEFNLNITRDMVSSRNRTLKKKSSNIENKNSFNINFDSYYENAQPAQPEQSLPPPQPMQVITQQQKLFDNKLYNLKEKYISSEQTKKEMKDIWDIFNDGKSKKILCISDLHAPYMDFEKVEIAIRNSIDCDICVLNGDIFDAESMSVFEKMNEIDASEEFEQVFELLNVLTVRFKHIIWVGGNHDYQRFCRYIMKNIKPGLRKFAFDRLNPMQYIADRYPNVIAINHNTLEIGDIIFKHPNGYSGVEMKTVVNELDILSANRFELPDPNFKAVIIGHTHDAGIYYKNGIMLMETGCLCYTPDYRFLNPTKRKWQQGYAKLELDNNGKIIFNKSSFYTLD